METKICIKCNLEKSIDDFRKSGKYYRGDCKECEKKRSKKYFYEHHDILLENNKKYREKHKEEIQQKQRKYSKENYKNNKQLIKQKNNEYYHKNKEKAQQCQKKYRVNNQEKIKKGAKKYYDNNKDKINKYKRKYNFTRRNNDEIFKIKGNIRHLINESFKRRNNMKSKRTEKIVGCSMEELINYLIKTYEDNYNEKWDWKYLKDIHIDHIIPLAKANTEEDIIKLCHYTNLQLLKAKDNLKKSDKLDWKLEV